MKPYIFLLVLALSHFFCYSQVHEKASYSIDSIVRHYMPINMYKTKYKKPFTKKDSLNFMFKDNDTLVLLENYSRPKGISVPYEYKDSTFLHYYKKVAFNHKNDSISKETSMKYWKSDIRLFFSESVPRKAKKDFMDFVESIDIEIDSLKITEVKKVEDSNYTIYYFGDYEYEPRLANNKKSNFYISWRHNKIYRGSIRVDQNTFFSDHLIQYKLRELFFQSLGYFRLVDDFSCESYFSNCYSQNKKISKLDIELLKYHYSYGICKGTTLETFERQHEKAKEILKETGQTMHFVHTTEDDD